MSNRRKKIEEEDERNERLLNSVLTEEENFDKLKKFAPIILLVFLILSLVYILYSALTPKTEPPATVFI